MSFLRDIQPILDRHCVECHSGLKPAGGLDFFGGLTEWSSQYEQAWGQVPGYGFNRAFETINHAHLVAIAEPNLQDASITPVLAYGAHKSKLFATLTQAPHTDRVTLSHDERLRLTMWMDANAPYHDTFVKKRLEKPAYDLVHDDQLLSRLRGLHQRRCASCHASELVSRLDWIDIHQADRSLFLRRRWQNPRAERRNAARRSMPVTTTRTTRPCGSWSKRRLIERGPTLCATCRHSSVLRKR